MNAGRLGALIVAGLLADWASGPAALAADCPPTHRVERGETLSIIAGRYLGDVLAYRELHRLNRALIGPDPSVVEIGTVLTIPCPGRAPAGDVAGAAPAAAGPEPPEPAPAAPDDRTGDRWLPLMSAAELAARIGGGRLQVLDIRAVASGDETYIPGALTAPFALWHGSDGPVPDGRSLSRLIGGTGLDLARPIVLVAGDADARSVGQAAWVYWLLKSAGADRLGILEPGFAGWQAAGLPVETSPANARERRIAVSFDPRWAAGPDEVAKISSGETPGALLTGDPGIFLPPPGSDLPSDIRAMEVLDAFKGQPVDWESGPVIFVSRDMLAGVAAWFYASEVAGIRNVRFFPAPGAG